MIDLTSRGLLASFVLGSTALAGGEDAWLQLDEEIASLSTNVQGAATMDITATLSNYYTHSSETDTGGWAFEAVRLNFRSRYEDFDMKVSTELLGGTAAIRDAFVGWDVGESTQLTWGRFKRPFSYHNLQSVGGLVFSRNDINSRNEGRDNGVKLSGEVRDGTLDWFLAVQNGDDDTAEGLRYTGRLALDVAGEGAFRRLEGAVLGRDDLDASIGIGYGHDEADGMSFRKVGIEGAATVKGFYFATDIVDYSASDPGTVLDAALGHNLDETTPFSITATYLLKDNIELAFRHEEYDDPFDTQRTTFGFNYYMITPQVGDPSWDDSFSPTFYSILPHKAKWIIDYEDTSSDSGALEDEQVRIGFVFNS